MSAKGVELAFNGDLFRHRRVTLRAITIQKRRTDSRFRRRCARDLRLS